MKRYFFSLSRSAVRADEKIDNLAAAAAECIDRPRVIRGDQLI